MPPSAGAVIEMPGACLSILLPSMGPATAQLPALSHMFWLAVRASEFSVPVGTFVESEKLASSGLARPAPLSLALQVMPTSVACQIPSAAAQSAVGVVESSGTGFSWPATKVTVTSLMS